MIPAFHPSEMAVATQPASVVVSTKPFAPSAAVPGFPMSSLSEGTPAAMIWNSAVFGYAEEEASSRPSQVTYAETPWL